MTSIHFSLGDRLLYRKKLCVIKHFGKDFVVCECPEIGTRIFRYGKLAKLVYIGGKAPVRIHPAPPGWDYTKALERINKELPSEEESIIISDMS